MNAAGTFAQHCVQLFEEGSLAESSWSGRRTRLPWEVFPELMRRGLRPVAQAAPPPDAFWRGWRLVALAGTQFSLTNTPHIKATVRKARSRRGRCRRHCPPARCCWPTGLRGGAAFIAAALRTRVV